jgi:hypothetical protein
MVFDVTFNNIPVISWLSVLLVEETGVPEKTTDLPQVTGKLYHKMVYRVKVFNCKYQQLHIDLHWQVHFIVDLIGSEWLVFDANSAIFSYLYHGESKLLLNEMITRSALY